MNGTGWSCVGLLIIVVGLVMRVLSLRVLAAFHVVDESIKREASFTVTPHIVHHLLVVQSVAATDIGKVRPVCVCVHVFECVYACTYVHERTKEMVLYGFGSMVHIHCDVTNV